MLRFNLHNHTTRSDGAASPRELAESAARAGLSHVGISDHLASTKLPAGRAVTLAELPAYVDELHSLRATYRDRLTILAGLEVSFSLLQTDFTFLSRDNPEKSPLNTLDYLLFEYVNDTQWFGLGLEELLKLKPFLQVPFGLAHNDLERNFSGAVPPDILARILAQAGIFVELCPTARNSRPDAKLGHLPYYRVAGEFNRRFFEAARGEGVRFSIGCDVHADLKEVGAVDDASRFLEEKGLAAQAVVHYHWGART